MKTHTLKVRDESRGYIYKAEITRKTGALRSVRAGCRHWRTFLGAHDHYNAHAKKGFLGNWPRWSDGWIIHTWPGDAEEQSQKLYDRHFAVVALHKLEARVEKARAEIQRARRKRR